MTRRKETRVKTHHLPKTEASEMPDMPETPGDPPDTH
jgi:hypothetical protein